jgi:conjugal transfer/type IV secretion protein DotA/TraY
MDVPGANADLFTGQTNGDDGSSMLEHVFRSLNITEPLLHFFTDQMSPTGNQWTDPFGALIILGQKLINVSLVAFGLALAATSPTATAATTFLDILTGNWGAAAATNILHQIVQFFATPIFLGILSLLIPGLTIAYILPMIPWVMWIAGVAGYLILVCEAVIAVPLWMLAHMTFEGAGLHGRATQGYELIFNVLFRPVLMLLGLFLGYFVFTSMSWLIRMTFGVAAHFVLENGWLVTNFFGLIVLLSIYVMAHVTAALMSFQMISLVPHHLPKLIGFSSANRVDMDEFSKAAAWVGTRGALSEVDNSTRASLSRQSPNNLVGSPSRPSLSAPPKALTGPAKGASGNSATGSVDSTLNASTDMSPPPSS